MRSYMGVLALLVLIVLVVLLAPGTLARDVENEQNAISRWQQFAQMGRR